MIVVDASVVIKIINTQEKGSNIAQQLLTDHIEGKKEITVPSLLFLEVANVLVTKSSTTIQQIENGLRVVNDSEFKIHSFTKKNLIEAARLAKKYRTTVYDMLYAVIAKEHRCTLITADEQFLKKTQFPFVQLLQTLNL